MYKTSEEPKTCVNCFHCADSSDEEPCSSCNRNPRNCIPFKNDLKDNWQSYTLGKETVIESKNPNIGKYNVRELHKTE